MTYKEYTQYKNASEHVKKMFDNFYIKLKYLRTLNDYKTLQDFYNKMHKTIIYKSLKYSPVYCQILSDVMY